MKVQDLLQEKFTFKDAPWPEAEGRFVSDSAEKIADWLWRTRRTKSGPDVKAMYGATVNFVNANGKNKKYAGKMQRVRDIIKKKAENIREDLNEAVTPAEQKKRDELYARWKQLVNMGPKELEGWMKKQVEMGKKDPKKHPGLKRPEAAKLGIGTGTQSAKWIIKMKGTPVAKWTPEMWRWAGRQVSFISRMKGNAGALYKDGEPTRKLLSLKVWGHDPEK